MPASNLSIGFKLVWRNKRRFIIVMSGTILAISILGAVFLVSNDQGRRMGYAMLQGNDTPISISMGDSLLNMTEYENLDDIVYSADALGINVVKDVFHDFIINPFNMSISHIAYFFTKNTSIDWPSFTLNEGPYLQYRIIVQEDYARGLKYQDMNTLIGRVPSSQKEIMVSHGISTAFSIGINDTISICNYGTKSMVTGYKVTGIMPDQNSYYIDLYMQYQDFLNLHTAVAKGDFTYILDPNNVLSVQVDIGSISIYTINNLIQNVNTLADRIQNRMDFLDIDFHVYNYMSYLANFSLVLTLMMLSFLALLVGMMLPATTLSAYVSKTIGSEMFERRAMEFSQFRSRGFSRKQMIKVLFGEVLVSSAFCSVIAGFAGIGMSYLFQSIASLPMPGSATPYTPFTTPDIVLIYTILIVVMSLLFVLGIYVQPVKLSFNREMIDSLKEKIKAHRQEGRVVGGIVVMFLLGVIPLGLYMVLFLIPQDQPLYGYLAMFSPLIAGFSIAAPFFLSLSIVKFFGDKKASAFGKICAAFIPRSKPALKRVTTNNITSKSSKSAKLSMIVLFTIAFGFTVSVMSDSLRSFRQENMEAVIGSDILAGRTALIHELNETRTIIDAMENVSRASYCVEVSSIMVMNMADPFFSFSSFKCDFVNLSDYLGTSTTKKDKFLLDTTWTGLGDTLTSNTSIAVLPSGLKSHVQGATITIKFSFFTDDGLKTYQKSFLIAGYYKIFPGLVMEQLGYEQEIIVNDNIWNELNASTSYYTCRALIKTPFSDQALIDAAGSNMNLSMYQTVTTISNAGIGIGLINIVDQPIFYGLLNVDYWLAIVISMIGIGILTFMRITAERKEIGLFRIRGFDSRMLYSTQIAEKFGPILIGGIVGIAAGLLTGIIATTSIAYNFQAYNPVINYPVDIFITGASVVLQAVIPLLIYLGMIVIAIHNELRQNLGSIMDEDD